MGPRSAGNRRTWVWWTSGKDSAWTVHSLRSLPGWDVQGLFGVVNRGNGRAEMHGVGTELLCRQAAAQGLPLHLIEYDWKAESNQYAKAVRRGLEGLSGEGAEVVAFSDLSSARYRERWCELLRGSGLEPVFPLWGRDPGWHVEDMLAAGLLARVCSVFTHALPAAFVGRRFDRDFVADLPPHVDVCGEQDEFHTFVEWAPGWTEKVTVAPGGITDRYGYAFAEMTVASGDSSAHHALSGVAVKSGGIDRPGNRAEFDPFVEIARLRRVRAYVDERIGEEVRRKAVAEVAAMTPSAFSRYFRRHVGQTFTCWLAARRVAKASALLRDPDVSMVLVARKAGFGTDRNFRRVFRKVTGLSPSQYRERAIQESRSSRDTRPT
ncbi:MAG: helix-turn-helix domain-containing protein [Holophagales bacterium]|nr:helix-turn-helix domain-containing protein [Holophagales bacterium]MXW02332.1 helix-turn-helix domain-containing protein [Holophagales bacterium]MYC09730.1 helix-turn-helix domain-containing protein [Holophagales bacterium]